MKLIWHTEQRKVNDLIPWEGNPRQMTEKQAQDLRKSLENLNLMSIPVIDIDNKIISGHQRMKIMQLLDRGNEIIDVRVPNRKLTDKEFLEANLRENKNLGGWDFDMLANFDEEMLKDVGWTDEEMKFIFQLDESSKAKEDEYEIPEKIETDIKLGDLFQLGNHRLMCGDATNRENVEKLMNDKKADMVFTDPPYNFENLKELILSIDFISKNTNILIMFKDITLVKYLKLSNFEFHRFWICKLKNPVFLWIGPLLKHILISHETKGKPLNYKDIKDGLESIIEIEYRKNLKDDRRHKHQKAVKDFSIFIKHFTKKKQLIVDLFVGSGTTLIACEQLNRTCYIMEIEPQNCQIIIDRWESFTGNKAKKI